MIGPLTLPESIIVGATPATANQYPSDDLAEIDGLADHDYRYRPSGTTSGS